MTQKLERRTAGSKPLRPGSLRCEDCGTTWFDQLADLAVRAGRRCRRCNGRLHTERRGTAVGRAA